MWVDPTGNNHVIGRIKNFGRSLPRARAYELAVLAALSAAGCTGEDTGSAPSITTVPVKGTVSVAGKPVSSGIITLEPLVDGGSSTQAMGEIKSDGSFEVTSAGGKAGATPGKYRVKLESSQAPTKKKRAAEPVTVEVAEGKTLEVNLP